MIRAVLFDVYKTLMQVGPPGSDAAERWEALHAKTFDAAPALSLDELSARCREIVEVDNGAARGQGIAHPEVAWPSVLARALGRPWHEMTPDFVFAHAGLVKSLSPMPGARAFLGLCARRGLPCGIVSNAQGYTIRELETILGAPVESFFTRGLIFWSFENGFSKPGPHPFRIVAARLKLQDIAPADTVMIGDRLDNDIEPSRNQGFQTWHLAPDGDGDWFSAAEKLFGEALERAAER